MTTKLTATQKLEALENTVADLSKKLDSTVENLLMVGQELDRTNEELRKANERILASIVASEKGGLSLANVNKILMDNQVESLKGVVEKLKENKLLEETDGTVGDASFVVGRELDTEGNVLSPRVQFSVSSLQEEAKLKVLGKKVGDSISEKDRTFEVTEVYNISRKVERNLESVDNGQQG